MRCGRSLTISPIRYRQYPEKTSAGELRFHTLSLDKRADVIIVFRIVRKAEDGTLTIVWKELDRKEAPKIKFPKGEKFADFKPDIAQTQQ